MRTHLPSFPRHEYMIHGASSREYGGHIQHLSRKTYLFSQTFIEAWIHHLPKYAYIDNEQSLTVDAKWNIPSCNSS